MCWYAPVKVTIKFGSFCGHRSHFGSRYTLGCCAHAGLLARVRSLPRARICLTASSQSISPSSRLRAWALASGIYPRWSPSISWFDSASTSSLDARASELRANAHTGSRTRVTSMGGLYDAATLCALVTVLGSEAICLFEGLSSGLLTVIIAEGVLLSSLVLPSLPCRVTMGAPPGLALSLVPPRPAYALRAWIVELGRRPSSRSRPAGRLNAAGRPSRANPSLEHKHLA